MQRAAVLLLPLHVLQGASGVGLAAIQLSKVLFKNVKVIATAGGWGRNNVWLCEHFGLRYGDQGSTHNTHYTHETQNPHIAHILNTHPTLHIHTL